MTEPWGWGSVGLSSRVPTCSLSGDGRHLWILLGQEAHKRSSRLAKEQLSSGHVTLAWVPSVQAVLVESWGSGVQVPLLHLLSPPGAVYLQPRPGMNTVESASACVGVSQAMLVALLLVGCEDPLDLVQSPFPLFGLSQAQHLSSGPLGNCSAKCRAPDVCQAPGHPGAIPSYHSCHSLIYCTVTSL